MNVVLPRSQDGQGRRGQRLENKPYFPLGSRAGQLAGGPVEVQCLLYGMSVWNDRGRRSGRLELEERPNDLD